MPTPSSRDDGHAARAPDASASVGERRAPTGGGTARLEERAWIEEHLDALLRFARRRLHPGDAEDVAAEAFAAHFAARREGRAPDAPGAYLLGVARNRIAERFRRRAAGREPASLPEGWQGFCERPLPDELLVSRELAELIHVALGLLSSPQRGLLLARYRDDVSLSELADREGTTPKAIEARLARARAALRELLRAVGEAWEAAPPLGSLSARDEGPR